MSGKRFVKRFVAVMTLLCMFAILLSAQSDTGRKAITKVKPVYPEIARKFHLTGTVKIQVTVAPSGSVKSTKIIGGHPVLAEAALDAVRKWKFEAASSETTEIIPFEFTGQ